MPHQPAPWWTPRHSGAHRTARLACLLAAPLIALGSSAPADSSRLAVGDAAHARYAVAVAGPLHTILAADAAAETTLGARGDLHDRQVRTAWQETQRTIDNQRRDLAQMSADLPRGLRDLHAILLDALASLADRYTLLVSAAASSTAPPGRTLAAAARALDAFRLHLTHYLHECARAGVPIETET